MSNWPSIKINTFVKVERTGDKVDVSGPVDFVAGSFDFLHIHEHVPILWRHLGKMADDQGKQFQNRSEKNKHLSILIRTSNDIKNMQ